MGQAWTDARRDPRRLAILIDLVVHALAFGLVLLEIGARSGPEAVLVAALLFPITYVLGPLTLAIVAAEWLPFALQLTALVGAIALLGVPTLDREKSDARSCLQVLASTLLVIVIDLALHVATLALVIDRVNETFGLEGAVVAGVLFPLTYLVGPLALAFAAGDWVPLILQLIAIGLIGLLLLVSDA